ncbi:MAG: hypothetical protein SVY53_12400, partial [Chloroflexota bacterium]|nr:hypothetical protein [Chloroflexota bacterium]
MSDKHSVTGWRKDPFTAIFLGLAMTLAGVLWFMINRGYIEDQEWWPFAISGAGCILIAECFLARMASPDHRRPMFGRLLLGIILVCVGVSIAFDIREWWPVIPIIVGTVFTLFG